MMGLCFLLVMGSFIEFLLEYIIESKLDLLPSLFPVKVQSWAGDIDLSEPPSFRMNSKYHTVSIV